MEFKSDTGFPVTVAAVSEVHVYILLLPAGPAGSIEGLWSRHLVTTYIGTVLVKAAGQMIYKYTLVYYCCGLTSFRLFHLFLKTTGTFFKKKNYYPTFDKPPNK